MGTAITGQMMMIEQYQTEYDNYISRDNTPKSDEPRMPGVGNRVLNQLYLGSYQYELHIWCLFPPIHCASYYRQVLVMMRDWVGCGGVGGHKRAARAQE